MFKATGVEPVGGDREGARVRRVFPEATDRPGNGGAAIDVHRAQTPRRMRRLAATGTLVASLAAGAAFVVTLEPAIPGIDGDSVWIGTVERGAFVRDVRGPGNLVPVRRRWITALTAGRVDQVLVEPGARVEVETLLYRLSNPDVEVQLLMVRQQLSDAEAGLVALATRTEADNLTQQSLIAQLRTQYLEAKHRDDINRELTRTSPGLVAEFDLTRSREMVAELRNRVSIEARRLAVLAESGRERLAAQRTQIERLRAIVSFNEELASSLMVRAGIAGVLAESGVEEGQWVDAGETMGRVVQPGHLKAELRIPQDRAQEVAVGLDAEIDTRAGAIPGRVARLDPAVLGGTVTVDVALTGELPEGVRPNMGVDGRIVLDRLEDVTFVDLPANVQSNERVGLYRVDPAGGVASRVSVTLGRRSVNEVEVLGGLDPGDRVVLSGMDAWENFEQVRIER